MDLLIDLFDLLLVVPMTNVLVALARVFGGNFGIAIIVFTLLMKIVTWPLTASQYKQSRAMQAIQPRMQELQKKYKGKDPKKLQQETMALYREAGVNPLGCLLPMLAQFPIWIALYQVVNVALGETPESFVNLSQQLYPISFIHSAVPLNNQFLIWNLGQSDATLILPLLVGATMYIQQKMMQPPTPTGPLSQSQMQQQQTQQMMLWMLPLMFGFWSLSVPAGLALYWAVSNIAGIVLQYFYMGRTFSFRSLLSMSGPPAPVPAATQAAIPTGRAAKQSAASVATEADDDIADDGASSAPGTEPGAAATGNGRRKRHGRRRGKR